MSLYISGMEMPTSCDSCMFSRRSIHNIDWCVLTENDIPCDCPIVPVQPHGRLIDANNLIEIVGKATVLDSNFKWQFAALVTGEPTVIPADTALDKLANNSPEV